MTREYYLIPVEEAENILKQKVGCVHQDDCPVIIEGKQAILSKAQKVDLDESFAIFCNEYEHFTPLMKIKFSEFIERGGTA